MLKGALTSRVYAFESRKWELQGVDSCDIYDPLVNTIRVEVLGLRTIRILPKLRQGVNEEWLSDKIRYCFDGIYNKRLSMPILKTFFKNYHILEWDIMLLALMHKMERHSNKCTYITSGELDGETLLMVRELNLKQGINRSMRNVDLKLYFLSNFLHIVNIGYLLLLNINLRRENPVLDFIIREKLQGTRLGVWDENHIVPHAMGMGNGVKNIFLLLKGKLDICKIMRRSNNFSIIICSEDLKQYATILEKMGKMQSIILPRLGGYVSNYELGGVGLDFRGKKELIYNFGEDDLDTGNVVYLLYQGHSGDRIIKVSDIILPSTQFTEKEGLYMNIFGEVYCTKFVFEPPGIARCNWRILGILYSILFFKQKGELMSLSNVRMRMYNISPSIFTRRYIFAFLKIHVLKMQTNINYYFSEYITTPFRSGTITRVSETSRALGRREHNVYYRPKG